jgi:hypothetical protein
MPMHRHHDPEDLGRRLFLDLWRRHQGLLRVLADHLDETPEALATRAADLIRPDEAEIRAEGVKAFGAARRRARQI